MQDQAKELRIVADDTGIHFVGSGRDIVVQWGEIESVDAVRCERADATSFLEIYINHFSGVDFRFHDVDTGYAQVMASMEEHLVGFSRAKAEAEGTWEEKLDTPVVWRRDESIQPFELHAPEVDPRPPTAEERVRMEAAHRASIATCEKLLGRSLQAAELACIHTGFENGRITGSIAPPLCDLLVERQDEINRRELAKSAGRAGCPDA